ncbi:Malate dehydrogenase [Nesidiocoris tenuis]|uniref:Malate dehydrogenase, mitochondrial n=1 Tax=Nesidiocoris tenuis TaxID=355587 RepID=A0ABN7AJ03_9HEMI|nr:Malate dehydrogenase [Nesidiocoris tenuis]
MERGLKIAVMGAMGKIGQPLSLLLKQSPWFDEIAVHDTANPKGLALELNHVDTKSVVTSHEGEKGHATALKNADIVLIVAGQPTEVTREHRAEESFTTNFHLVMDISKSIATTCPQAATVVVSSPVNSTLPIACEVFKKVNRYVDPCKMFGLMTLNVIRANTHLAEVLQMDPEMMDVPVIGGNSPTTAVPVLSQSKPCAHMTTEEVIKITRAIQGAGDEVIRAENGKSSAILSIAYATARFAISLAKALNGVEGIKECAMVMSNVVADVSYFASPLQLGLSGIEKNLGVPDLTSYECCLLETALPFLKTDIEQGERFIGEAIKVRAV